MEYNPAELNSYLSDYYRELYPAKLICKWLSYGKAPKEYLERREIAFIFENDVHHRYQTFLTPAELQKQLVAKRPHKIDIGAVYNAPARNYKSIPDFRPVERELVFDIDLTDYEDVRKCCKDAKVCDRCWKFIVIAARVLRVILNKHFGFKHMLWIFSGRRGMHCWVADKTARQLDNNDRAAVAAYLTFRLNELPFDLDFVHPFAEDAYRAILDSPEIDDLVVEQDWLNDEHINSLTEKYCSDKNTCKFLRNALEKFNDHALRWKLLKEMCDRVTYENLEDTSNRPRLTPQNEMFLRTLILDRLNPRLDANVTTATNHLLKSPFCVHPKTGTVAVPFSLENIDEFSLNDLPRVDKLVSELKSMNEQRMDVDEPAKENFKTLAYKHTSVAPYIQTFEKFINEVLADE